MFQSKKTWARCAGALLAVPVPAIIRVPYVRREPAQGGQVTAYGGVLHRGGASADTPKYCSICSSEPFHGNSLTSFTNRRPHPMPLSSVSNCRLPESCWPSAKAMYTKESLATLRALPEDVADMHIIAPACRAARKCNIKEHKMNPDYMGVIIENLRPKRTSQKHKSDQVVDTAHPVLVT